MPDIVMFLVPPVLAPPTLVLALKVAAAAAGLLLGVRLLGGDGCTADDRDRMLVDAARRRDARL